MVVVFFIVLVPEFPERMILSLYEGDSYEPGPGLVSPFIIKPFFELEPNGLLDSCKFFIVTKS